MKHMFSIAIYLRIFLLFWSHVGSGLISSIILICFLIFFNNIKDGESLKYLYVERFKRVKLRFTWGGGGRKRWHTSLKRPSKLHIIHFTLLVAGKMTFFHDCKNWLRVLVPSDTLMLYWVEL